MWTLTIDGSLFDHDCEKAWQHCKKKRVISQLVRGLRRRGLLLSDAYFCAVEWQKNGMVHFHLLIEAKYVPFDVVCKIWNRNRPADAGPVEHAEGCKCVVCSKGEHNDKPRWRPGFGSVKFTLGRGTSALHAINYATKYLCKQPAEGYPEWILDSRNNVCRYQASRNFWEDGSPAKADAEYEEEPEDEDPTIEEEPRKTIRQRVANCRVRARVRRVDVKADGRVEKHWLGLCTVDYETLKRQFAVDDNAFSFVVSRHQVGNLIHYGDGDDQDEDTRQTSG